MKTIRIFALLFGLVMASACTDGNFTMNTEIRADGTCSRDIWFKADSATLVDSTREQTGLVRDVINNAAWQKRVWINDSSDDLSYPLSPAQYDSLASLLSAGGKSLADTLSIHASREFSSVGEMAANWPVFIDGERLKAEAKLEKKFRWFYTDYTFCETFECLMPKFGLPLTDFLTQDEVDFWLKGEPNLFEGVPGMEMSGSLEAYEKIVSRWVNANLCNDDALAIAKYYDSIPNPPMSRKAFVAKWDSLVRNLDNFPTTWFDKPQYFVFQNAFNSDFYQKLSEIEFWKKKFDEKNSFYVDLMALDCDYNVISMPGKIEEAPQEVFESNHVPYTYHYNHTRSGFHYRLKGYNLLASDYKFVVCSREKNIWAYVVTVVFALGLLFFAVRYLWRNGRC